LIEKLLQKNIIGGVPVVRLLPDDKTHKNQVIIAATEMNTDEDINKYAQALAEVLR
jgi:glycine dehydrogenase subunit 1